MTARSAVPERFKQKDTPTPRQLEFISDLLDQKDLFAEPNFASKMKDLEFDEIVEAVEEYKKKVQDVTKQRASQIIDSLLSLPSLPRGVSLGERQLAVPLPEIEDGWYAIQREGTLKFYRVKTQKYGMDKGTVKIDAQASDDFHPVRSPKSKQAIIIAINRDRVSAMEAYGQEIGRCGRCGRTLTDETSRELGIGPVCRRELGI